MGARYPWMRAITTAALLGSIGFYETAIQRQVLTFDDSHFHTPAHHPLEERQFQSRPCRFFEMSPGQVHAYALHQLALAVIPYK